MRHECIYSDDLLINIEKEAFRYLNGRAPDRGECANIQNRILCTQTYPKEAGILAIKTVFARKHHRWPTRDEYIRILEWFRDRVMEKY